MGGEEVDGDGHEDREANGHWNQIPLEDAAHELDAMHFLFPHLSEQEPIDDYRYGP